MAESDIVLLYEGMPDLLPPMERAPGLHVSTIIKELCVKLGHLEDDDRKLPNMMQLGCALEFAVTEMLERKYPNRYVKPGELTKDGISGNPDLLDTTDFAVEEIKLAYMSSKHEPDGKKHWRYWTQVKAYCTMVGTEIGRLHVCHVVGDWKGGDAIYNVWERRFSEQELRENWRMLLTHGERMRQEGRA